MKILGENVVVHSADSGRSRKVGVAKRGRMYDYILSNSDRTWHCIRYDGRLRWVSAIYSSVIETRGR